MVSSRHKKCNPVLIVSQVPGGVASPTVVRNVAPTLTHRHVFDAEEAQRMQQAPSQSGAGSCSAVEFVHFEVRSCVNACHKINTGNLLDTCNGHGTASIWTRLESGLYEHCKLTMIPLHADVSIG